LVAPNNGDEYLTRREAEILIASATQRAESATERALARWAAHDGIHAAEKSAIETALAAVAHERVAHVTAHEAAHDAHNREHSLDNKSQIERDEHHEREHKLEAVARDKAEEAVNVRLEQMNEFRSSLADQATTFVRKDTYDALVERVITIEKLDIKGEGKSLGQGAVIAAIVGSVGFVGTLLGLIVVLANVVTSP
jgi:hypothetical protein